MPPFFQLLLNGFLLGGIYSLVSTSLALIYGTMKIINFAHGDFLMLGMYSTFWIFYFIGLDPLISMSIIIPVFFVLGYLFEKILITLTLKAESSSNMLLTIGLSIVLQNLALFFWSANFRRVSVSYGRDVFKIFGLVIEVPKAIIFFPSIILCIMFYIFLKKTFIGVAIRAVSQDIETAEILGIDSKKIYAIVFGLGLALIAIAGALISTYFPIYPFIGSTFMLMAFVVVSLGGTGNYVGTLISSFIIGIVESFSSYYLLSPLRYVVILLIFISILLLKPEGLFGKRLRE